MGRCQRMIPQVESIVVEGEGSREQKDMSINVFQRWQ